MLLLIDGSMKDEKRLHDKFFDDKYRGEWYYLSEDIKEFIKLQYDNDKRYDEGLHKHNDESVQTRYVRTMHGLNLREMGDKLGVTPQSVRETEYRELQETISIGRLKAYGKPLGYDLVYKFVKGRE
jgi:DNA-binding XRE family transcriptional regulator